MDASKFNKVAHDTIGVALSLINQSARSVAQGNAGAIFKTANHILHELRIDGSTVEESIIYIDAPFAERNRVADALRQARSYMRGAVKKATESPFKNDAMTQEKLYLIKDIQVDFTETRRVLGIILQLLPSEQQRAA